MKTLGVDEHIWHHLNPARRGPKALTGMVDLSRDEEGTVAARLLDLVPGRTGAVCANWLTARGEDFCNGIQIAPGRGRKGDPLYRIPRLLQTGIENLTESQDQKIEEVITADPCHEELFLAF